MEDASEYATEVVSNETADLLADEAASVPAEPAVPITSRFLYVDVAALRAKQLRRGARLRYDIDPATPAPKKPERQAMEEVRRCLVQYTVPTWRGVGKSEEQDEA